MARARARTHCAACGVELDDSTGCRHRSSGGWLTSCKACWAARRRQMDARPPRYCAGCGRLYQRRGRTSSDPVTAVLRDILCGPCRRERGDRIDQASVNA